MIIHTDGGCQGNPGPGGWAAVLQYGPQTLELSGAEPATTNNRMELAAAIQALSALNRPCHVRIHTDSEYLRNGITSWIHSWKRKGWQTSDRKPVRNVDLWKQLDLQTQRHTIQWAWVKGHAGNPLNEQCDTLARNAIDKLRSTRSREELRQALDDFIRSQDTQASLQMA